MLQAEVGLRTENDATLKVLMAMWAGRPGGQAVSDRVSCPGDLNGHGQAELKLRQWVRSPRDTVTRKKGAKEGPWRDLRAGWKKSPQGMG